MHTGYPVDVKIYYLSESAVTIEFGQDISEVLLQQITAFNNCILSTPFPGFITAVPAYTTISIFYNPITVINAQNLHGADCYEKVANYLLSLTKAGAHSGPGNTDKPDLIFIPTCYGNQYGPDIEEVAKVNKLAVEEVISLHSTAIYKVFMLGFVPGFAYLSGMNPLIEAPRKPTPIKAVPVGSVGIAGKQTGIYPFETPGGWQLIGKTPLILFDALRKRPSLLQAGNEVIFKPVSPQEFEHIAHSKYADTHY